MLKFKKIMALCCLSLSLSAAWAYPEKNAQEWVNDQSQTVLDFMKNTPRGQWEPWFQKEMPEVSSPSENVLTNSKKRID